MITLKAYFPTSCFTRLNSPKDYMMHDYSNNNSNNTGNKKKKKKKKKKNVAVSHGYLSNIN